MSKRKIRQGIRVLYPQAVEEMLGIVKSTRWKMERRGKLPPRDVFIAGIAAGWKPETIEQFLSSPDPEKQAARNAMKQRAAAKARAARAQNMAARKATENGVAQ